MHFFRYPLSLCALLPFFILLILMLGITTSLRAQTFHDASNLLNPLSNDFEWGASAADFNNDGQVDIYHPGRLYINKGPLGFEDIMGSTGINEGNSIFGAAFGDYDDDGRLDVLFEDFSGNSRLYRNRGNRRFTHVNSQVNLTVHSLAQGAAWCDYDRNGTLDLYVNNDLGDNQLFKNIGNAFFIDVSDSANVPHPPDHSYGTAWGDYNNDGYADIFIASCHPTNPLYSRKHLLRNNGDGTFTDVNTMAGVGDSLGSWGIVWLDYDNDGDLDIYIANTEHTPRPGFNRLYQNQGDGTFLRMNDSAGVSGLSSENSFGVAAADFDNDGWIDIYVANSNHLHRLYHNNGDGTFTDIATQAGITENNHSAVAVADFNGDGWLDIFTAGAPQNRLMLNDGGSNHYIRFNLRGVTSNHFGVGARVEVHHDGMKQIREIRAGDSFCSQNNLLQAHFGLGSSTMIDSAIVRWTSGAVDVLTTLPTNQEYTIVEGMGVIPSLQPFSLLSPLNGDVVPSLSPIQLTWESATNNPQANVTYRVYLTNWPSQPELELVFSGITDTTFFLPVDTLQDDYTYLWSVEASDGYTLRSSSNYSRFMYSMDVFLPGSGGVISNDASFSEGAAWADVDGDDDLDVMVANILDQNNRFYVNNGNGSFGFLSTIPPSTDGGFSYGSQFVDYDGDGDLDLYVVNRDQVNFLYQYNNNWNWTRITSGIIATEVQASWSGAWVDIENDGDMDLFVSNFNQPNSLYLNAGDGTFSKVTTGEIVTDVEASVGCAWGDYDNDGFQDLFVANANFANGQNNSLYRNNGDGTFTKVTGSPLTSDGGNSVGGSWGDYDNDGDLDLFVANYFNEDNFLYRNDGNGMFTRITDGVIVNDGGNSVGSGWGDYDYDGDLDLYVSDDGGANRLYVNMGNGVFVKGVHNWVVTDERRSNAINWVDVDNDGDLDLFVVNGDLPPNNQNNQLYFNGVGENKQWLQMQLVGTVSNHFGVGSRVLAYANIANQTVIQMRDVLPQNGYNAQSDYWIYFGFDNTTMVDSIRILWPSGRIQTLTQIATNQRITVVEDSLVDIPQQPDNPLTHFKLFDNYPNPFNPSTHIQFQIPGNGLVILKIFDILGREVKTLVNAHLTAGEYTLKWDGTNHHGKKVSSGVYLYQLSFKKQLVATKKMLLLE
ncbi:MAG: T9SS C-terminal target domain-containing protein [Calditrichaeota bacterium]|nr:MAG: T9SS C-terminal target domain-containing protein [Calditrichota bacterium]